MDWLFQLPTTNAVAYSLFTLSLVSLTGLAVGSLKYRGVGLGSAGVLWALRVRPEPIALEPH